MPAVNGTNAIMPAVNGTFETMTDVSPFDVSSNYPNGILSRMNIKCIDSGDRKAKQLYICSYCSGSNAQKWGTHNI
jgi:hypothetical protein